MILVYQTFDDWGTKRKRQNGSLSTLFQNIVRIYTTGTPRNASCGSRLSRLSPMETKTRPSLFPTTRRCTTKNETDRQTDVYLYFLGEGAGIVRPESFFGKSGGRTTESKKKVVGSGFVPSSRPQRGRATTMILMIIFALCVPRIYGTKRSPPSTSNSEGMFTASAQQEFEIRYYRENINTAGDAPKCELRVAIITDGDQESAFPLPDYAQEVYNEKQTTQTDRQTNTYYYIYTHHMNKDDCNAPHFQPFPLTSGAPFTSPPARRGACPTARSRQRFPCRCAS